MDGAAGCFALAVQPAVDVGDAAGIAGDHHGRLAGLQVLDLALQHGGRDLGVFDREDAAKAAAFVGIGQLDELAPPARPPAGARGWRSTPSSRSRWQEEW